MIYRVYPSKDTFITNYGPNQVRKTGSNFGSCEIVHLFKVASVSGAAGGFSATASFGNILSAYDLTTFMDLTGSGVAPVTGSVFTLWFHDTQHDQTLPYSFDVTVQAVSQDWDEGRGHDVDNFSDIGVANWISPKSNQYWSVPGASGSGPIVTQHFDTGHENLSVDVTPIVNAWLTGGLPNYGFLIQMSASVPEDYLDKYVKMFHGRETFFPDRRPYVQMAWNDVKKDNRNNFYLDVTGTLYLYNEIRGSMQNISSVGTGSIYVRIEDLSGTVGTFTGSYAGSTGLYSVTLAIPSASYSGSLFDIWHDGTRAYMTGTLPFQTTTAYQSIRPTPYVVNVVNLRDRYFSDEKVRMSTFARPRDYNPAAVLTASVGPSGVTLDTVYYQIVNDRTGEVAVGFDTGSLKSTQLSYDGAGNYFDFYMSNLSKGSVYRMMFLVDIDGQLQIIDRDVKFRVV